MGGGKIYEPRKNANQKWATLPRPDDSGHYIPIYKYKTGHKKGIKFIPNNAAKGVETDLILHILT